VPKIIRVGGNFDEVISDKNILAHFYRAMHFSAKRGIAIACRLSVRPSVCLYDTIRYDRRV